MPLKIGLGSSCFQNRNDILYEFVKLQNEGKLTLHFQAITEFFEIHPELTKQLNLTYPELDVHPISKDSDFDLLEKEYNDTEVKVRKIHSPSAKRPKDLNPNSLIDIKILTLGIQQVL